MGRYGTFSGGRDQEKYEETQRVARSAGYCALALTGIALLVGSCGSFGNKVEYSNGVRTGMINKISKKGLVWKTYEGQLALEGIVSGANSAGANVWNFSFDNSQAHGEDVEDLVQKTTKYLESGQKVRVKYIEQLYTWPWRSSNAYLVQSVEPAGKQQ